MGEFSARVRDVDLACLVRFNQPARTADIEAAKAHRLFPNQSFNFNANWSSFEVAIRIGPGCRSRYGSLRWNWRGNTVCIR